MAMWNASFHHCILHNSWKARPRMSNTVFVCRVGYTKLLCGRVKVGIGIGESRECTRSSSFESHTVQSRPLAIVLLCSHRVVILDIVEVEVLFENSEEALVCFPAFLIAELKEKDRLLRSAKIWQCSRAGRV